MRDIKFGSKIAYVGSDNDSDCSNMYYSKLIDGAILVDEDMLNPNNNIVKLADGNVSMFTEDKRRGIKDGCVYRVYKNYIKKMEQGDI